MVEIALKSSSWITLRALTRVPLLCVFAALIAFGLTRYSLLSRVEVVLSDQYRFSEKTRPGDNAVQLVVDEATVKALGKYPYDRDVLARVLDIVNRAGAGRVYLDSSLNLADDPSSDNALEAAFERLGPSRLALPVTRIGNAEGAAVVTQPLPRFAQHATLVTTDVIYDPDRRVRQLLALPAQGYAFSMDWLHDRSSPMRIAPLSVDFSYDPTTLPRYGMLDLVEGRVDPAVFTGKHVIVGLQLSTPQFMVAVPVYQQMTRIDLLGLAFETLQSNRSLSPSSPTLSFLFTLAMALACAAFVVRLSSLAGFIAVGLLGMIWFSVSEQLQRTTGVLAPVLAPPLAGFILWQSLKLKDSRLGRFIGRQRMKIVGVGKSALVAAVDVVADPAAVFDAKGIVWGANDSFRALGLGDPGKTPGLQALFGDGANALLETIDTGPQSRIEFNVMSKGGARYFEASIRWIETITEKLAIAGFKDVTEAVRRQTELSMLAYKDPLTGLSNRAAFNARMHMMGAASKERPFGILVIDLDGFKQVNDTLGHHAGDLLLIGVARRIEDLLRSDDAAARLGGDEYAILVASGDEAICAQIASRLLASLREPFNVEGQLASVGASIGIAICPAHHGDAGHALKLADAAMYVAKRAKPAYAIHSDHQVNAVKAIAA